MYNSPPEETKHNTKIMTKLILIIFDPIGNVFKLAMNGTPTVRQSLDCVCLAGRNIRLCYRAHNGREIVHSVLYRSALGVFINHNTNKIVVLAVFMESQWQCITIMHYM